MSRAIHPSPEREAYKQASCDGKEGFASFELANTVLRRGGNKKSRQIYKCDFCHDWHVGNKTK